MDDKRSLRSVLIIEDDFYLLEAVSEKLKTLDIEVLPFRDGNKAINYLVNAKELPDLIWLDYYLKDMNGLIFMHELKELEGLSQIPVVVVSNSQNEENEKEFKELGVVDYIVKTQKKIEDIVEMINNYLRRTHA